MRRLLILLVLILSAGSAAAQQRSCGPTPLSFTGTTHVVDGSHLFLLHDGKRTEIRLRGIQAPPLRNLATGEETVAGMRSRVALIEMLGLAPIKCDVTMMGHDCRIVADCSIPGQVESLSTAMVAGGWAYINPAYEPDTFLHAEEYGARKERRGHWRVWLPPERR
jgi:endonuclease YncB( thermonuclease family)